MTERIKLTTREVFKVASGEPTHWGVHVFDVKNTRESSEYLVDQILDDQMKAEKCDELSDELSQACVDVVTIGKDNNHLKELNTTLSKALAEEMASNFKQANLKQELEEKLERIKEECDLIRSTGIPSSFDEHTAKMHVELNAQMILVKKIEEIFVTQISTAIDPALQAKDDAKRKFFEEDGV